MLVEQVMDRYRELGSTLEASIQVRQEAQQHWHRLYETCWCGYLTVPAKYYEYDKGGIQTNTQEDAEKAYLASLSPSNVPTLVNVPAKGTILSPMGGVSPLCPQCSERPPEVGRSVCSACRKRAYRERSQ